MMRGEDIVCFSKDWGESRTSNHHVLLELARHNRVLWIDSVATRSPDWSSTRDRARIVRKLAEFTGGPRREGRSLWRVTPLVLPWPHAPLARAINRRLVRATIRLATERLGMDAYQLWTFLPTVPDWLDDPRATLKVYYCTDEWSLFRGMDSAGIVAAERRVLEQVDLVLATCDGLVETKRRSHPNVVLAPHGVDHAAFSRALQADAVLPDDLAALPGPRIGFHGTLDDWVDVELLAEIARRRPDWSFVLLGPEIVRAVALDGLANVHRLGPRPHAELPSYAAGYAAALVPYRLVERMRFVSPLKVREYLAAGVPVVSTALPEVMRLEGVSVAQDAASFVAALERAIAEDSLESRLRRSASVAGDTWRRRVEQAGKCVMEIKSKRDVAQARRSA
jgi:glycosyltransferase involved in cell wall biosynthesis